MAKQRLIFIVGIWIMALSYLGLPTNIKKFLFLLTGLVISGFGFFWSAELRRRRKALTDEYYQHKEEDVRSSSVS